MNDIDILFEELAETATSLKEVFFKFNEEFIKAEKNNYKSDEYFEDLAKIRNVFYEAFSKFKTPEADVFLFITKYPDTFFSSYSKDHFLRKNKIKEDWLSSLHPIENKRYAELQAKLRDLISKPTIT